MRITVVSREYAFSPGGSGPGADAAALAGGLVSAGHSVRAIALLPDGMDPGTSSLARRLSPMVLEAGEHRGSCVRYDGRTSGGIDVHFLEMRGGLFDRDRSGCTTAHAELFSQGAAGVLRSLHTKPDWTVCWDDAAALVPVLCRREPSLLETTRHLLSLWRPDWDEAAVSKGAAAADQVVASRTAALRALHNRTEPLRSMLLNGHAVELPSPVAARFDASPTAKRSAKATCQARLGLPVRPEVLLVLFPQPATESQQRALGRFIQGDVQAVAFDPAGGQAELAKKYPDRLGLAPPDHALGDLLRSADGCIAGDDPHLAARSMACGCVPLVAARHAAGLVDLEPSLASGSSIIVKDLSADALVQGLGRLSSACKAGRPFQTLLTRLPGFVLTWAEAAKRCDQLMAEKTS